MGKERDLSGHGIRVIAGNPNAAILRHPRQTIVANGLTAGELTELRRIAADAKIEALMAFVRRAQEATVLLVDHTNRTVAGLRGWSSNYELLFRTDTPSALTVSDNWRNMIATIPVGLRELSTNALVDHLLFGAVSGDVSYLTHVERLGHGTCLNWSKGYSKTHVFDRPNDQPGEIGDATDWVHVSRAISEVIDGYVALDGVANMLSGGVDSTLVHTYLGNAVPSISAGIDSPEFAFERAYAEAASRILGTSHRIHWIEESRYPEYLRDTIRLAGLPPHLFQSALIARVFESDHRTFITSQLADALFGLPRTQWALRSNRFGSSSFVQLLAAAGPLLPRSIGKRFQTMRRRATQIAEPLVSGMGLGAHFMLYTDEGDLGLANSVFEHDTVRGRVVSRAEYVEERLPSGAAGDASFVGHLQFGHLLDFLCDDSVSQWRQAAYAKHKQLLAPFIARPVVDAALSIPPEQRYIRDGRVKHVLKDILRARQPEAPVDAKKGGGDLPLARYLRTHPLQDAAAICRDVGLLSRRDVERVAEHPILLWNLLSISLWKTDVLADAAAGFHPATDDFFIPFEGGLDRLAGQSVGES